MGLICNHIVFPDIQTPNKSLLITYGPRGRLGNQMFQYASLLGIAASNNRTPFIRSNDGGQMSRIFRITNIKPWKVTPAWSRIHEDNFAKYDSHLFEFIPKGNVTLDGFFQSFKYFQNVLSLVKKEFTFIEKVDKAAREMLHRLHNGSVSIGVHVRRGDMTTSPYETMPSRGYYHNAMDRMRNKYGNVTFFVASHSKEYHWVRENLRNSDVVFLPKAPAEVSVYSKYKCL